MNHNASLSGSKLNEFVFQYADFDNHISARSQTPYESFPNGVTIGQNINSPQTTAQKKYQFRDDFSWHVAGKGGLGHDFKAGVNFINEPRLFITFNTGKGVIQYTHLTNDVNGPVSNVTLNDGDSHANIPLKQYAAYIQDDWRVSDRLTLNLGLRYDLVEGPAVRPVEEPQLRARAAARRRRALRQRRSATRTSASRRRTTPTTVQPRLGAVWDVRGNAKDLVRAGWGIYTDFGYTNSNVLFPAADASGSQFGTVFTRQQHGRPAQSRRQLLPGRPAADQPRRAERGGRRCRSSASGSIRGSSSRRRCRRRSAGRTSCPPTPW